MGDKIRARNFVEAQRLSGRPSGDRRDDPATFLARAAVQSDFRC